MKKILSQMGGGQNFIYESIGGGGHKYDFHFLFWHQNALASGGLCPPRHPHLFFFFFFSSFMVHFSQPPSKNENMKRYAYAEMPLREILLWQCTPSLDHTQVQTFYKVYIVSNFRCTKGQFTTPPPHQKLMSLFHVRKQKAIDI